MVLGSVVVVVVLVVPVWLIGKVVHKSSGGRVWYSGFQWARLVVGCVVAVGKLVQHSTGMM